MLLADFCNRPHDTSTRELISSRARGFRRRWPSPRSVSAFADPFSRWGRWTTLR